MMDGIIVVNQEPIMTTPTIFWFSPLFFFLLLFCLWCAYHSKNIIAISTWIMLAISCFIIGIFSMKTYQSQESGKYIYTVKLEKDIDYKEYNEKYVELNQQGELRIIKERK